MTYFIFSVGLFVISLLAYSNVLGFIISLICLNLLPLTYQLGLDYCEFEECSNMLELNNNDDENKEL